MAVPASIIKISLSNDNNRYLGKLPILVNYFNDLNFTFLKISKLFKLSLLLKDGDIESNPGPQTQKVMVSTYNARGLKNRLKLKRVLNSCHKIVNGNKNAVIFLQETHLEEGDLATLEMMWHHELFMSPGTNRQCGCLILYDPSWVTLDKYSDNTGRICILALEKLDTIFIFANIYAPNNHDINFFSEVFNKLIELQISHPGAHIVLGGDFNLVISESDSINRVTSIIEAQSRTLIKRSVERLNLIDTYRVKHQSGGFTWYRGDCMSRLDMIFVSAGLCNSLTNSRLDWTFDDSDHALVESTFELHAPLSRGPGLMRINADVLDDEHVARRVEEDVQFQLGQIPADWNPHTKIDFAKSVIRSVISNESSKKRKINNQELLAVTEQLGKLMQIKEKLEIKEINNPQLLMEVNNSIKELEIEHNKFLDDHSKMLSIRAQTKWYEKGEKSNKYFLNIIKKRSDQKLITRLSNGHTEYTTQPEIMNHVTDFYRDLYDYNDTNDDCETLLSDLPKLTEAERQEMDRPITLEELRSVLNRCGDSAPGPDGIPYKIYRILWSTLGPYLLDAWKYSLNMGLLPLDQRVSAITLLPKQGKDPDRIENWRPITLSNCDLKIFTKLLSFRVSKVLDRIIHPCQTAYIPGRVVHDNLRMFDFYNRYCRENNIDALLISLDAKKAFDSVSHKYMYKVLSAYGFSDDFIKTVQLLYKDLKATILVNGYKSVLIKILRSVKQGDALSCALFILCIDPLIRKIENNPEIKSIPIPRSRLTNIKISNKIGGFADDIGVAIKNDSNSIKNVFKDYGEFSRLSGIKLNIDKTEVLKLNFNSLHQDFVPYPVAINDVVINTKESLNICGICFSNNSNTEYEENILEKISKMERQLIIWLQRPLSVEGKILIVKTFGLSQLIYALQMADIREGELIDIERMIFKFLWNKKWVGSIAPDRIKRSILKLPYDRGGLNAPDIKFLNWALKIKQFIRSMKSTHPINLIQKFHLEKIGYDDYFKCEYAKICTFDPIVRSFQINCNKFTDFFRERCGSLPLPDPDLIVDVVNVIASTDILEYLMRKRELLIINRFGVLANLGIVNYKQLHNESLFPSSNQSGELARYILGFFPRAWSQAILVSDDINCQITYEEEFPSQNFKLINHKFLTVKNIKSTLSESIEVQPFPYTDNAKFKLMEICNHNPFLNIRKYIKTPRDRFFKYRILQGDIFCNERLFRFRMTDSSMCSFCTHTIEDIKHVLWECPRSTLVWSYIDRLIFQAYHRNYITYNVIVVGSDNPIPLAECIITIALKLILTKDRSAMITTNEIKSKIKAQYIIEQMANSTKKVRFTQRWSKLETILFRN